MNTIPWYKSNTLRGLLIAAVAQLVSILNLTGTFTTDAIAMDVDKLLDLISLGATAYAAWARTRQPTPPVTQAAAVATVIREQKVTDSTTLTSPAPPSQKGFVRVQMLSFMSAFAALTLACMTIVIGCTTPPSAVFTSACGTGTAVNQYGIERCSKATADVYAVYQKRGLELLQDPTTPADVRTAIKRIDAIASPIVHDILTTAADYVRAKASGVTVSDPALKSDEAHLMNLQAQLQQQVTALQTVVGSTK